MKIDRKYIQQLAEVKARHPKDGMRMSAFFERLGAIDDLLDHAKTLENSNVDPPCFSEIYRYIPIAAVALLQGYLATVIRDIVNSDTERCVHVSPVMRDVTVRLDSLIDINKHSMTIGDIAASAISINSVKTMQSILTDLLGEDSRKAIGRQKLSGQSTYASVMDTLLSGIEKTFRWRHMYCHELAIRELITFDQAEGILGDVAMFIVGVDRAVNSLLLLQARSHQASHATLELGMSADSSTRED